MPIVVLAAGKPPWGFLIFMLVFFALPAVIKALSRAAKKSKDEQSEREWRGGSAARGDRPSGSKDELAKFLEALSGQTPAEKPPTQRPARPAQPHRPRATPLAEPRAALAPPLVREVKQAQPRLAPARPKPLPKKRIVRAVEPKAGVQIVEEPVLLSRAGLAQRKRAVSLQAEQEPKPLSAADRLDAVLPAGPLKRAIILRDLLGPCRARMPFRAGRW